MFQIQLASSLLLFRYFFENYKDGNDMEHLEVVFYLVSQLFSPHPNVFTFTDRKPVIRGHSKSTFVEGRWGGDHWEADKNEQGNWGEGLEFVYVHFFLKKMLRFLKWSFIVIDQLFRLIIMAAWNVKGTLMQIWKSPYMF